MGCDSQFDGLNDKYCACGDVLLEVGSSGKNKDGKIHRRNMPCYYQDSNIAIQACSSRVVPETDIFEPLIRSGEITVNRRAEMNSDGTISLYTLEITNPPNSQSAKVLMEILPGVLELFLQKNRDYGDGTMDEALKLGPKAQFVDMWRKIKKLKRALWDGEKLENESAGEIVMDFIGHGFLVLLDLMPPQYRK